jgi:hypothetical protein
LISCSQKPVISPSLSHMNPIHGLPSSFIQIHFNTILSFKPVSSK